MLHKESHTLSNEDDIARHPKLLKDLRDHLRNEIGTICERQMMRVPEEEGVNMSSIYTCPNCETDLLTNWKVCPKCGRKTGFTKCDKCGETICCDWKYCPVCGKKL